MVLFIDIPMIYLVGNMSIILLNVDFTSNY